MIKDEKTIKNEYKLFGAELEYKLDPNHKVSKRTADNFQKVVDALKNVGVDLSVTANTLRISVNNEGYVRSHYRNAGNSFTSGVFQTNSVGISGSKVYYSDMVLMMQTMSDKEIMDEIGMKHATYYRHKKAFLESECYKNLDLDKAKEDESILDVWEGNAILF